MSKLDLDAARALLSAGKEAPDGKEAEFQSWLKSHPTMFVLESKEHSGRFNVNFAKPVRHFVHRITGGCGNMEPEFWLGLQHLIDVLSGQSEDETPQPKMTGLGLFGGTRMLFKKNPDVVRPGVTEVFPACAAECDGAAMLGIVARTDKMHYTDRGLVISTEGKKDFFTIVHPVQVSIAVLQENADVAAPWNAEFLRCADIVGDLQAEGWGSLLTVYNGGMVSKDEIELWCKMYEQQGEGWNVLLIKGSGGIADKLSNDAQWLAEHPNVHVADANVESMRSKLLELGAITPSQPVSKD
jgi:hypothetical protein